VALEERHQPGDLVDHGALLRTGEEGHHAAVGERVAACAHSGGHPFEELPDALGIGLDGVDRLVDEPDPVLAQPWHTRELRPVGDLVQRQPQPELAGRERELLLEGQHVRPHVVHEVLLVRVLVLDHEQVVLAEHPGAHPPEHHPELGPCEAGGDRRQRAGADLLAEALEDRAQETLERREVGPNPPRAVGHPRPGGAGERSQAGLDDDQLLGLGGQHVEVGLQRVVVVRLGEGLAARHADGDLLGEAPVDGAGHAPATASGIGGRRPSSRT
jgi:hypothetical protein